MGGEKMVGLNEGYMNEDREIMNSKSFSSLDKYLDKLPDLECVEILNMLGCFDFSFRISDEELNHLAEKIGENKRDLIPFISGILLGMDYLPRLRMRLSYTG